MISQLATSDIETLQEKGLTPTPADIIRLNALGLKIELSARAADIYELPRVAYLGHLILREPTLAHGEWFDKVDEFIHPNDHMTWTLIRAYALCKNAEYLPDPKTPKAFSKEVKAFIQKDLKDFVYRQVRCAVVYAVYGNNAIEREFPATADNDLGDFEDTAMSVYCGELLSTVAMGLGLSVRDIGKMTLSQARRVRMLALSNRGLLDVKRMRNDAEANYFRTLNEIENRLTKEKENGK